MDKQISRASSPALLAALSDVRGQLEALVHPGFITETGAKRLPDLVRYLRGMEQRLDKIGANAMRDRSGMAIVQNLTDEYQKRLRAVPTGKYPSPELLEVRWMLEELRISLFAQTLGTPYPVSEKRIRKALAAELGQIVRGDAVGDQLHEVGGRIEGAACRTFRPRSSRAWRTPWTNTSTSGQLSRSAAAVRLSCPA